MLSISLGPLALPVAPLVLVASCWAASVLAARMARAGAPGAGGDAAERRAQAASQAVFMATLWGLLAARAGHVALHAAAYLQAPSAIFDVRDGGWNAVVGALAGAAWLLWRARRTPELRCALAVASLAGAALWLAGSAASGRFEAPVLPELVFRHLADGSPATLRQSAQGRPLVVNLWASWCGPCRAEMPVLAAAQQREAGVAFVFVNQGEAPAAVRAYLDQQALPLREVLLDPASSLGRAVGSHGLPTTLFYDAGGRLADAHFGVLNGAALAARLDALQSSDGQR